MDDLPINERAGYDVETKTILLDAFEDDILTLSSDAVHEGRHWVDDTSGVLDHLQKQLEPKLAKYVGELFSHHERLLYDIKKGILSHLRTLYEDPESGGWVAISEWVIKNYFKGERP